MANITSITFNADGRIFVDEVDIGEGDSYDLRKDGG